MPTKIKSGICSSVYKISNQNVVKVVFFSKLFFLNLLEIILYFTGSSFLVNGTEYKLTNTYYAISMPKAMYDLSKINGKGPPPLDINESMYQMALGVKYLHSLNIIHGDIKPSNFLVFKNKNKTEVKLTDFGLSNFCFDTRIHNTNVYTIGYKAPELFKTESYSFKSDIWALGQVFKIFKNHTEINELVTQMTLEDEESRWNIDQVLLYLKPEHINKLNINFKSKTNYKFIYKTYDINPEIIKRFDSLLNYFKEDIFQCLAVGADTA